MMIGCAGAIGSCDDRAKDAHVSQLKEFELLTHPSATDVERHRLPEIRAWQLNYRVKISYPEIAVGAAEKTALIEMGWTECEDWTPSWQSFLDETSDDRPRCVYQQISRYRKADMLLSISHYYEDQITENYRCPDIPATPLQTVVVAIHSYDDVEAAVGRLNLTCEKQ